MSNYDTECLKDIERRRDAGFAPSAHERDFLIRLAREALAARERCHGGVEGKVTR